MFRSRRLRALAVSFLFLGACGTKDERASAPDIALRPAPIEAYVAHTDGRLGLPSFVWITRHDAPRFDTAREAARATLLSLAPTFSLRPETIGTLGEAEIHDLGRGPIVAAFSQTVGGVEVFRGGMRLLLNRAFEPVAASGLVVPRLDGSDAPFTIPASDAMRVADRAMTGADVAFTPGKTDAAYTHFSGDPTLSLARAKKVLFPVTDGLVPGWHVELMSRGAAMSYVVSATDGEILFRTSLSHADAEAFTYRVYADATTLVPMDSPVGNATIPHPTGKPDKYKPAAVTSQLVRLTNYPFSRNDPWLDPPAATTNGNNVNAYADLSDPDGLGPAAKPTDPPDVQPAFTTPVATPKTFDYTYDTTVSAGARPDSIRASIVHLFYTTNFMHDWFYDAGFDEKSGNPQLRNFGRGGAPNDPLLAEAQDYSGKNNANAQTPGDGASPKLQMFVFSGPSIGVITVPPPASFAGDKPVGLAGFGKDTFDVTAPVALANDGVDPDRADACDGELGASLAGKIALVHRGTCPFIQKAKAAQAGGAKGVIIVNMPSSADPTVPPFMGGTDDPASPIGIPILSLALADGQAVEAAVAAGGLTVRMHRFPQVDLDGGLDTSIIAHEWGHVLSNRLIGNGSGLTTNQAGGLGEGWSDFVALMLLARKNDAEVPSNKGWTGAYPKGAYAMMGSGADYYFGIRRYPYSLDFAKNPLTFKHIQNGTPLPTNVPISFGEDGSGNSEVHATGEVWASMLWECYASLLAEGRLPYEEAQARMKSYLVAALKTTPVDPTLLEARDAVLAAAYAGDAADLEVFYKAFARRGAGTGALGPPKESTDNVGVTESFGVGNDVQIVKATLGAGALTCDGDPFLDEGEIGSVDVVLRNVGIATLEDTAVELATSAPGVVFLDDKDRDVATSRTPVGRLLPFETRTVRTRAAVRGSKTGPIRIDVRVTEPTLANPRVLQVSIDGRENTDETPQSSATDGMETKATAWAAIGLNGTTKWSRKWTPQDGTYWSVPNQPLPIDQKLVSPAFTIDATTFSVSFRHRYSFRHSTRRNVDVDGGVVELSTDNGATWVDISSVSDLVYPTKIDPGGHGDNPLLKDVPAGQPRKAYGNKSAGYPAWVAERIAVTLPEQPKTIKLRFRAGSSTSSTGAEGWDVDDVSLEGISSTPFVSFTPHADRCAGALDVDSGPGQSVYVGDAAQLHGSGTHPLNLPLTYVWTQVAGPPVVLRDATSATPSFDAPPTPTTLGFIMRANDGTLVSAASAPVEVKVLARNALPPPASTGCSAPRTRGGAPGGFALGAVALVLLRRARRRSRAA